MTQARVAQLAERQVSNLNVEGSIPFSCFYIMNNIEDRINHWCDILEHKAKVQTFGPLNTYFHFSRGKSYYKILMTYQDTKQDSVHAFVNKKNGDIYKPASWSAPYKDVRYNLWTEYDKLLNECDWAGSYLYKR